MSRKRLAVAVSILLVALAVAVVIAGRSDHSHSSKSHHAEEIDHHLSPVMAMFHAEEGSTPCETAYNAYLVFDERARQAGTPPEWEEMPSKEVFLARCLALSDQEQLCLQPRYAPKHKAECDPILSRWGRSVPLFEVNRARAPGGSAAPPPSSPPPPASSTPSAK